MLCLVAQSCPTDYDPMDRGPPGPSIHGILQARILGGLPCPPPGDLLNPEIEPRSPALLEDSLLSEPHRQFLNDFKWTISWFILMEMEDFPGGSDGKASAYNVGDPGSIPGSGRSPGEGSGNPFQYSCLENPTDGGAWWATVHGVAKSWGRLSDFTFTIFPWRWTFLNVFLVYKSRYKWSHLLF